MIKRLKITNFKSHLNTDTEFANLTIITGMNGVGKSSLIQALLLLRQSFEKDRLRKLHLVGDLYSVGSVEDAVSVGAGQFKIGFTLTANPTGQPITINLEYGFKAIQNLNETRIESSKRVEKLQEAEQISLFNTHFQYLSAFRNGPSDNYTANTSLVKDLHQISEKEGRAELIANFIDEYGDQDIPIARLKYPESKFTKLLDQINAWMAGISRNVKVSVERTGTTNYKIEYSYLREGRTTTRNFSSKNVGYGISYDLPIVTALLSASPGDLIIIENPEAHIHPSGQAELMKLVCKAAHCGVQIVIETHSDHIINGALVCCKQQEIDNSEIKVYYFDRDEETHSTKVFDLKVEAGGRIKRPPKGFFDQIGIDMKTLMGF